MVSKTDIPQRLRQADDLRQSSRWQEALVHYQYAEALIEGESAAAVKHNMAVCYLAIGEAANALKYADAALSINKNLWQSEVIKAKAYKELGQNEDALKLLVSLIQRFPANAEVRMELASASLHELGDAAMARKLVEPLTIYPEYTSDATLTSLMARLYDRQQTAEGLTNDILKFATKNFDVKKSEPANLGNSVSKRKRIGLISSHFCCSPVYFFCIGALKHLAEEFDFYIFNRGRRSDWATREFQTIALHWFDVADLGNESLATELRQQDLDVLVDLGGWMDPVALKALASKPAKRMYKWVGGQSATTGLRVFDGMFSDEFQSPLSHQRLYTEPLILLKSGYVTYTMPSYMPSLARHLDDTLTIGVVSNPAKVSSEFLLYLKHRLAKDAYCNSNSIKLNFIDKRYRYPHLQKRITAALRSGKSPLSENAEINFVVPNDHLSYLNAVGQLHTVIDTFPYTGGLTTMEALSLGVPCRTRTGKLFSERHTYAHCVYAGMSKEEFDLDSWNIGMTQRKRTPLIAPNSKRLEHEALAKELAHHFVG